LSVILYGRIDASTKEAIAITSGGLIKTSLYGNDGTTDTILLTDNTGKLQVDIASMPSITVTTSDFDMRDLTSVTDSISAVQSGNWSVILNDGEGNSISHFDNALGVALYGTANGTTKTVVAVNSDGLIKTSVMGNDGTTDRILKTDTTGKLNVNTTPNPSTGTYMNINVGTTGQVIKNSAALLTSITASNLSGSMRYLRIYNKATAPTDSDDASGSVFLYIIPLQANSTMTISYPSPVSFGSGLAIRATVGVASGDTNAPGSNEVVVNVAYI
jgi:hypothetical protein